MPGPPIPIIGFIDAAAAAAAAAAKGLPAAPNMLATLFGAPGRGMGGTGAEPGDVAEPVEASDSRGGKKNGEEAEASELAPGTGTGAASVCAEAAVALFASDIPPAEAGKPKDEANEGIMGMEAALPPEAEEDDEADSEEGVEADEDALGGSEPGRGKFGMNGGKKGGNEVDAFEEVDCESFDPDEEGKRGKGGIIMKGFEGNADDADETEEGWSEVDVAEVEVADESPDETQINEII
jgi:hypothetical protein